MGLDMFLISERYVWQDEESLQEAASAHIFPELPAGASLRKVEAEVGYWRKANAIHRWFVHNVQDGIDECQKSKVDRPELQQLQKLCEQVMAEPNKASTLLPTSSGFFFGSTDYSEAYWDDIKMTIDVCQRALKLPENWDIYYQSSW